MTSIRLLSPTARRGVSLALGAALTLVVGAAAATMLFTQPAAARCIGTTHLRVTAGWGSEQARYQPTCDGDGYYAGRVDDLVTDGYQVEVRLNSSPNSNGEQIQAVTGATANYSIWGDHFLRVCKSGTAHCTAWYVHTGS